MNNFAGVPEGKRRDQMILPLLESNPNNLPRFDTVTITCLNPNASRVKVASPVCAVAEEDADA